MNFNTNYSSSAIAIIGALLLIGSVISGAMAAGVDTETTNTPATSEVTEGFVLDSDFNGSVDSPATLTATMTSTDGEVRIIDPDSGAVINTLSTEEADEQTYSGSSLYYYNYTINSSRMAGFPVEANETKDVQFEIVDNATVSEENETTSLVNATITGAEGYSYLRIGESVATDDDLTTFGTDGFSVLGFSWNADNYTSVSQESVNVSGSDSMVTMAFANSTAQESFDTAASNADDGSWIAAAPVQVSAADEDATFDDYIKVYAEEAPDSVDSSTTYGVYDSDASELTVHVGDDVDAEQVDISATGNNKLGLIDNFRAYGFNLKVPSLSL